MNQSVTESPLQMLQRRQQRKEEFFLYGMIISFIVAITTAIFIEDQWRVASIEAMVVPFISILLFCRNRTSNCVHSLGFAIHLENKDSHKALAILKSSDCIRNADAFAELFTSAVKPNQK